MTDRRIVLQSLSTNITLTYTTTSFDIDKQTTTGVASHTRIENYYVLKATFDSESQRLTVSYVTKHKGKKYAHLVLVEGQVQEPDVPRASSWVEGFMRAVYDDAGIVRGRRVLVLVNPFGGTKKGASLYVKKVEPILQAAGCQYKTIYTTHRGHAQEIAKSIGFDYDVLTTVSGDGLVHEVLNGLAQHEDPVQAFSVSVAPIPTGSGNGLALNLLGRKDGFDVGIATLNVVKGSPMRVDLFSFTQGGKRTVSFMSQSLGLMADLDIGTDHLRWMGDTRFMYGLLRGIIQFKPCPVQLSFKVAENDKDKMAEVVHLRTTKDINGLAPLISPSSEGNFSTALPPLKYHKDEDGWTTFDEPIIYVYAGKGPYVSRDFMAFPVSLPDDGLIDLTIMPKSSRGDILACMDGAPEGSPFWHPKLSYVKAHAYRVKPLTKKGYLAVDGEQYPFEEFDVEVHQGLGCFLSPHGHYVAPFTPRTPAKIQDMAE